MSELKFQLILDSNEQLGVNVGDTRRNSQGLAIFKAVQADFILEETIKEFEDQRVFGLQRDGSHGKAVKYGEIPWPQSTDPKQSWRTRK